MASRNRVAELDGLRGVAALVVVAFHVDNDRIPWGWAAVDLFFVLSGYLITGIVLGEGGAGGGRPSPARGFLVAFYGRRALRIWPIYYLAVVGLAWSAPPGSLPYFLAYAQNLPLYLSPHSPRTSTVPDWPALDHTWTLAIEEQFYFAWPLAVLVAGRRRLVPALCLATLAGSATMRGAGFGEILLLSRCDGLALGALLAALRHGGSADRSLAVGGFGVAAWLYAAACLPPPPNGGYWASPASAVLCILGPCCAFYGLVGWITGHAGCRALAPLRLAPLAHLGTISYGLYLYHLPVICLMAWSCRRVPGLWRVPMVLPVVAISVLLSRLSWRYVESPILRLKRHFPYEGPA